MVEIDNINKTEICSKSHHSISDCEKIILNITQKMKDHLNGANICKEIGECSDPQNIKCIICADILSAIQIDIDKNITSTPSGVCESSASNKTNCESLATGLIPKIQNAMSDFQRGCKVFGFCSEIVGKNVNGTSTNKNNGVGNKSKPSGSSNNEIDRITIFSILIGMIALTIHHFWLNTLISCVTLIFLFYL